MLDAVTALNEFRAARQMGLKTFALWRLGTEDPSLWSIWDRPERQGRAKKLTDIPPGDDVDSDGEGDILRITGKPHMGSRTIDMDSDDWTVTDEHMTKYPQPYTIQYSGYKKGELALSFRRWSRSHMDAEDSRHSQRRTSKLPSLSLAKQAEDNIGLLRRDSGRRP